MGADGGVCWIVVRDVESLKSVPDLLAPWWSDITYMGSRSYEDSRYNWIDGVNLPLALFGGYGTDIDYGRCSLRGLDSWLEYLEDSLTSGYKGLSVDATFSDFLEEIDTRGNCFVYEESNFEFWIQNLREHGEVLMDVKIQNWLDDIRGRIVSGPHWEETWT